MSTQQKGYIALNGEESIEWILRKVEEALRGTGEFSLNQTWHKLEFIGGLKIRAYHRRGVDVKFSGAVGEGDADSEAHDFDVKVAHGAVPPDKVRESLAGAAGSGAEGQSAPQESVPGLDLDEKRVEFERAERERRRVEQEIADALARSAGAEAERQELEREKLALAARVAAQANDEAVLAGQEAAVSSDLSPAESIAEAREVLNPPNASITTGNHVPFPAEIDNSTKNFTGVPYNRNPAPEKVEHNVGQRRARPPKLLRPGKPRENRA